MRQGYDPVTGMPNDPPAAPRVLTPDEVMDGAEIEGPVLIFDFDTYYMGGCLAELLRSRGHEVRLATPHDRVSPWTAFTGEQGQIHARLLALGVNLFTGHALAAYDGERAALACLHGKAEREVPARSLVLVGVRAPQDALYHELGEDLEGSLERIGDCLAPGRPGPRRHRRLPLRLRVGPGRGNLAARAFPAGDGAGMTADGGQ